MPVWQGCKNCNNFVAFGADWCDRCTNCSAGSMTAHTPQGSRPYGRLTRAERHERIEDWISALEISERQRSPANSGSSWFDSGSSGSSRTFAPGRGSGHGNEDSYALCLVGGRRGAGHDRGGSVPGDYGSEGDIRIGSELGRGAGQGRGGYGPGGYGPGGYGRGGYEPGGYGRGGYDPRYYEPRAYDPGAYRPRGYEPRGSGPGGNGPRGNRPGSNGPGGNGPTGYGQHHYRSRSQ